MEDVVTDQNDMLVDSWQQTANQAIGRFFHFPYNI